MLQRHRDPTHYREIAQTLRQLAGRTRFDLCRRDQLLALAAGFERLAAPIEREMIPAEAVD